MKNDKPFPIPVRAKTQRYSCDKCPAYCCTYTEIEVTPRDIERLARHFDLTYAQAEERFTKTNGEAGRRLLRHRKDRVFDSTCTFLLQKEVVDRMAARPGTPDYGRLSVMLQYRFAISPLLDVP
ncbi:MAG TPA: rRNA adenine N-6-methyltransferase family protein, partial [Usitatibacter sp.]|nr:rRNA adenine N-6-methyltransferase family protein [Usitatibacter sp.]